MTTVFEPAGLAYLAPLLLLPLFYICLTLSHRDAASHGFWFGAGMFLCGTYWIYLSVTGPGQAAWWIGALLVVLLTLIMAAYMGLTAGLMARLAHGEPWWLLVVAPAVWTAIEWLRGWLFSGFPWMSLGYSQIDTPLAGWAPALGIYGVSIMLLLSSVALLAAIRTQGGQRLLAAALFVLPWLCGALLGAVEWTQAEGSAVRTTIIQAGIPQDEKWKPERRQPSKDFYYEQSRAHGNSQLVVWPEVAIPSVTELETEYIESVDQLARSAGQTILFGILEREREAGGDASIYNSLILAGRGDRQVYRKRHLVPFGEYFPVPAFVREWMRMRNLPFTDLRAGAAEQDLLRTADGTPLAVAICYEDSYGAEQLYALPEAALLINVSNDAWFGDSIAPHQHLQIARMRSLEVGRDTIRATNTGISAFIDAGGRLLQTGAQFQPVTMTAAVQPRAGETPYVRYGNWPVVSVCFLLIAVFWLRSRAS